MPSNALQMGRSVGSGGCAGAARTMLPEDFSGIGLLQSQLQAQEIWCTSLRSLGLQYSEQQQ